MSLLVAGCGSSKHAAVTRYVHEVNSVTSELHNQLAQVAEANRLFGSHASFRVLTPQLAEAQRTLRTFAARLSALHPPPEARTLAATLARLVAVERSLVAEMYRFSVFLPAYRAALVPFSRASATFRTAAHAAKTRTVEAAVVQTYANELVQPIAALARLRPPAVLRPAYAGELRAIADSRRTALALAAALAARQTTRAHALVVRLAQIGVSTGSVAAQRAQIAAVRAYDGEVARVSTLATAAQRELERLQRHS